MDLICNFCNNKFKSAGHLKRHKTTVKYCLKIQKEKADLENVSEFICTSCSKVFATNQNLQNHINICKENFKNIISDLQKSNDDFQKLIHELQIKVEIYEKDHELIKEIAKQPKNTVNNNVNNKVLLLSPFVMTQKDINSIINEQFTKEYFLDGQKGVAKFTNNNILKDSEGNPTYICTDTSRNVFNFKSKDGRVEKDIKAIKLTETISPAVITKSEKIYKEIKNDDDMKQECMRSFSDIKRLSYDNDKFSHELCILTSNKADLVAKLTESEEDEECESDIEPVISAFTEIDLKNKEEYEEKLKRLKTHENQSLYNYHLKVYNKKYGSLIDIC